MRSATLHIVLAACVILFSTCKKEYVEPFDFFISGKINGVETFINAHEDNRINGGEFNYYVKAMNNQLKWDPCGPKTFQKETSSRISNNFFLTNEKPWEKYYMISWRECVQDSADVPFQDIIKLGSNPILGEGDKGSGIVISYWRIGGGLQDYSTRLGPQNDAWFTVTSHNRVDGYDGVFHYITSGHFSCTLYNELGVPIHLQDMSFKIKTIPVVDVVE